MDQRELNQESAERREQAPTRWKVFAFATTLLIGFGSHYSAHVISTLKSTIKTDLGINNAQYGVLQAAVALVNTVFPIIGGRFIDMFGTTTGSMFACTCIALGALLLPISAHLRSFGLMFSGRMLYGLGSMTIITVQQTMLSLWFRSSSLSTVVGLQIATSRLASYLATLLTVPIKKATGWYGYAFWVAFALCFASWIADIVLVLGMRSFYGKPLAQEEVVSNLAVPAAPKSTIYGTVSGDASGDIENSNSSSRTAAGSSAAHLSSAQEPPSAAPIKQHPLFSLAIIDALPRAFWIIIALSLTLGAVWTVFLHISPELIMQWYGQSESLAAFNASFGQVVPLVAAPAVGRLMDARGMRPQLLIVACLSLTVGLSLLWAKVQPPIAALLLFSLSLGIGPVAMVSSIGLAVDPAMTGTALGIYKTATNVGAALLDPAVGWLQDITHGYTAPVAVLICVTLAATVLAALLWATATKPGPASGSAMPDASPLPGSADSPTSKFALGRIMSWLLAVLMLLSWALSVYLLTVKSE